MRFSLFSFSFSSDRLRCMFHNCSSSALPFSLSSGVFGSCSSSWFFWHLPRLPFSHVLLSFQRLFLFFIFPSFSFLPRHAFQFFPLIEPSWVSYFFLPCQYFFNVFEPWDESKGSGRWKTRENSGKAVTKIGAEEERKKTYIEDNPWISFLCFLLFVSFVRLYTFHIYVSDFFLLCPCLFSSFSLFFIHSFLFPLFDSSQG